MEDILDNIETTEDAFLSASSPKTVCGVEMQPFSLIRQALLLKVCGVDQEEGDLFFNAVICAYLCSLPDRVVFQEVSRRGECVARAFAWAERVGITLRNSSEVLSFYARINAEFAKSADAVADVEDNEEADEKKSGELPQPYR